MLSYFSTFVCVFPLGLITQHDHKIWRMSCIKAYQIKRVCNMGHFNQYLSLTTYPIFSPSVYMVFLEGWNSVEQVEVCSPVLSGQYYPRKVIIYYNSIAYNLFLIISTHCTLSQHVRGFVDFVVIIYEIFICNIGLLYMYCIFFKKIKKSIFYEHFEKNILQR